MAFNNPAVPWSEVERVASGRSRSPGDGSDAPAWSRKRDGYAGIPEDLRGRRSTDDGGDRVRAPYAELHCHSNFSFLDGASHPETLVEQAARAELDAIILTDHDGTTTPAHSGLKAIAGTGLLATPQANILSPAA